ncbi:MAG: DUF423 domain-containing protein [Pelistega sp.]|nr:DUF423 domain-containing protein [Pelistega sp.]
MLRFSIIFAAISGFLSVALGAFGAHALKHAISPEHLAVWHTAVLYQLVHTLAILAVAALSSFTCTKWAKRSIILFMAGILLFSGSLYALVLVGIGKLGIITPIGGTCFLLAWLSLLAGAWSKRGQL